MSKWIGGKMYVHNRKCQIEVKPEQIHTWAYDTWVFKKAMEHSARWSQTWEVCMNKMIRGVIPGTWMPMAHAMGWDTKKCERCENDYYDSLLICHAEEGTKFILYENSGADYRDSVTEIVILKDFKSEGCENPLKIEGFERGVTTDSRYTMKYINKGKLNGEVSSLDIVFLNRLGKV